MAQFRVVDQHEEMRRTPTGDVQSVVKVTAQLPSGTTFSVDVPRDAYTAEYVAKLLDMESEHFAAVDAIGRQ